MSSGKRGKNGKTVAPVKDMGTVSRMQRAYTRDEQRMGGSVSSSRHKLVEKARETRIEWRKGDKSKTTVDFGYGPVNLSKFPTRDRAPKVTTLKGDYSQSSVGHKYSDLTSSLVSEKLTGKKRSRREKDVADELLYTIEMGAPPQKKRRVISEGEEANAATKMLAISHISEPERVSGVDKKFRSDLRRISKGIASFEDVFGGSDPQFGMAKTPNLTRKRIGKGRYKKSHSHSSYLSKDEYFSDSSDED